MASGTHVEGVRERVVGGDPRRPFFFSDFRSMRPSQSQSLEHGSQEKFEESTPTHAHKETRQRRWPPMKKTPQHAT